MGHFLLFQADLCSGHSGNCRWHRPGVCAHTVLHREKPQKHREVVLGITSILLLKPVAKSRQISLDPMYCEPHCRVLQIF